MGPEAFFGGSLLLLGPTQVRAVGLEMHPDPSAYVSLLMTALNAQVARASATKGTSPSFRGAATLQPRKNASTMTSRAKRRKR